MRCNASDLSRHIPVRIGLVMLLVAMPALAHVKWFSRDANGAMPPLAPLEVIGSPHFVALGAISLLAMILGALLDGWMSRPGTPPHTAALTIDRRVEQWVPHAVRLGLAAFFCVAVLYFGGQPVYLTPELHAKPSWVPLLQLAIAAALLRRSTAWLGSLGIAVLYAAAIEAYGWFHLLDYPVFLGAAAFVAIDSLNKGRRTAEGLAVLRACAAVTLMWGGAEKWLYPWWSDGVLEHELRAARGPFSSAFFMAAAGWVEFCAAYALMFGRLGTQIAALVLLLPFVAAIPIFGMLDAIGHAPIIIVLLALALTQTRLPAAMHGASSAADALGRGISCIFAALATIGAYWGLQAFAHGSPHGPAQGAVAGLLVVPLLAWGLPQVLGRSRQARRATSAASAAAA
jgi:hypothetical protein